MTEEQQLEELLEIAFTIIAQAGDAKGHAYEALNLSEQGKFEEAKLALKLCDDAFVQAHHYQTQLIQKEVNGEAVHLSVILIHAQDHLMSAITEKELIKRLITMNKRLFALENR